MYKERANVCRSPRCTPVGVETQDFVEKIKKAFMNSKYVHTPRKNALGIRREVAVVLRQRCAGCYRFAVVMTDEGMESLPAEGLFAEVYGAVVLAVPHG